MLEWANKCQVNHVGNLMVANSYLFIVGTGQARRQYLLTHTNGFAQGIYLLRIPFNQCSWIYLDENNGSNQL